MAINWSNDSTVNQVRPAGHKRLTMVDIDGSGLSSHTVTGIPSDAAEVNIHMINYSMDSNGSGIMRLRCGNGSIDSGGNYSWGVFDGSTSQGSNGNNYFRCIHSSHSGGSHVLTGSINLIRATHSEGTAYSGWIIKALFGDVSNNMIFMAIGRWNTIGVMDRFSVFNAGGHSYDSGARMIVTVATGSAY